MSGELCINVFLDVNVLQLSCIECPVQGRGFYVCLFFPFPYLVRTLSEVQAAMQMSQSWEESLSLVMTTQRHSHSHSYQCFADSLRVLELTVPPLCMLWAPVPPTASPCLWRGRAQTCQINTVWELTGPPVSEGQTESVV